MQFPILVGLRGVGKTVSLVRIEAMADTTGYRTIDIEAQVRVDRCAPTEKKSMRALAELGPDRHRSGDIAERLSANTTSAAPARSALIKKGMIYSATYGDTAFTVPVFDDRMRRTMPLAAKRGMT